MKSLLKLNKYLWHYKWHILLGGVFVISSNYFRILQPQYVRKALDAVIEVLDKHKASGTTLTDAQIQDISTNILYFGGMVVLFAIIMGLFMFFMRQTIIVMSRKIEYDLRRDIYKKYQSLSTQYLKESNTGDLMSRVSEDVTKVRMYLGPGILYAINLTSLVSMTIYAMVQVSPKLTLYALMPLPVLSVIIYFISSKINERSVLIQQQIAALNTNAQEVYSGIKVIKAFNKERVNQYFFEGSTLDYKNKSLSLVKIHAFFFPMMVVLIGLSTILTVYVAGIEVGQGDLSPGNIAEFIIYVNMLTWPVTAIGWIASIVQQAGASQSRINEILDLPQEKINTDGYDGVLKGQVTFEAVDFRYEETQIQALDHVSFNINAGEKVAILGKTGSGKSSILEVLLGLYTLDSGVVSVDGHPIDEWNTKKMRSQMGYVPQDVFLFSTTIYENIVFGLDEPAPLEKVIELAKIAGVHDDIMELPQQYETLIGERGVTLSGGQKQRISIVRALILDPQLLILDDSLSAVDTTTEASIMGHLLTKMKERTLIMVTHRLHFLNDFDKIIYIQQGKVIFDGTPAAYLKSEVYHKQEVSLLLE